MIQIGKYRLSLGAASIFTVFIVLSTCAVIAAIRHADPENSLPLYWHIMINETIALLITLTYGITLHITTSIVNRLNNRNKT